MRYCDVEAVRGVTYAVRRGTTTTRLVGNGAGDDAFSAYRKRHCRYQYGRT